MKHSIKKQFTLIFAAIFAGIILFFILCNVFLLRNFYTMSKYRTMRTAFEEINLAAKSNSLKSQDFLLSLRQICENNNISAIIMDEGGKSVVSYQGNELFLREYLLNYFMEGGSSSAKVIKRADRYSIQMAVDPVNRAEYLELIGELDNNERILIRSSVAGIKNSVRISNIFLFFVAVLGILIGMLAISLASRRITTPILELTSISEKMAGLDFDAKYKGVGDDEIDRLGKNMNNLSEKLESAIGELKQANAELKTDIERKEEAEQSRREFIANASHELKTPLALIQGYAEGLKEGISEDKESRDYYCDVIVDEASKMNELVKNLMSLNELEMGTKNLNIERFDLSEMIENQIQTLSILAIEQGAMIEYEKDPVEVWSDEFKVEEAFRNYLTNALNHASGDIKLIIVSTEILEEKGLVRVNVFNTGTPIPEESLPKLWDKFYKVDKARTREYGGSGVGLSIVKATMELLGQEYGCENREDGVLFYFCLPIR